MRPKITIKSSTYIEVIIEVEKNTFVTDTVGPEETKCYPILKGITIKELK